MLGLVARRLLKVVPLLLLVTVIAFGLLNLVPGDPAVQIAGEFATPETNRTNQGRSRSGSALARAVCRLARLGRPG